MINATSHTPSVDLNPESGIIRIEGKSTPVNAEDFFSPILKWIEEYCHDSNCSIQVQLNFEFLNVASSKRILFLLYKCHDYHKKTGKASVTWYYSENDIEMMEIGRDYAFMVQPLPFQFQRLASQVGLTG